MTESYIDVSPIARTARFYKNPTSGLAFPEATEERGNCIVKTRKIRSNFITKYYQEENPGVFHGKYIGLFASINNVLDSTYKTGGFEQARNANFRALNQDVSSGTPSFGPKYYYGYGRTYFVNLTISL